MVRAVAISAGAMKLFVIVLLLLGGAGCASTATSYLVGSQVPAVRFTMMNGARVSADSFRGKRVVIAFWATHCSRSKQMLRHLADVAQSGVQKGGVAFVAPSIDPQEKLSAVQERELSLNVSNVEFAFSGNDVEDEAYLLLEGKSIPYIVILDRDGSIMYAGGEYTLMKSFLEKP